MRDHQRAWADVEEIARRLGVLRIEAAARVLEARDEFESLPAAWSLHAVAEKANAITLARIDGLKALQEDWQAVRRAGF